MWRSSLDRHFIFEGNLRPRHSLGLGEDVHRSRKAIDIPAPKSKFIWHILWLNLSRPVVLLTQSFICFILSLYFAMWVPSMFHSSMLAVVTVFRLYGINILMLTTFPNSFHWCISLITRQSWIGLHRTRCRVYNRCNIRRADVQQSI